MVRNELISEYLFNVKYRIANQVSGFPTVYTMISKGLTGRDCYTTRRTDIVIDGHQRSANTYATFAFQTAQPKKLIIANHIHKKSQFLLAEKYGVPAILLIRNPLDCISSLLIRQPKYSPYALLCGYYSLYNALKDSDGFVVGEFDDIITNYAEIIRRINIKFGRHFGLYYNTPEHEKIVQALVETQDKMKYASLYDQKVAYPNQQRKIMITDIKNRLLAPAYKKEYTRCEKIYAHFLDKRNQ